MKLLKWQIKMSKILIAEDDKFLVSAYKVKLIKEGFDVKIAQDGDEAIELVKSFSPDVIILDLVMPKKDGFATLEEIKEKNLTKAPIIVASNLGQSEDVERAKKLGAVDYVVKSDMKLSDLVLKIKKALG